MTELQKFLNLIVILLGKIAIIAMFFPILIAIFNFKYLNKILKIMLYFNVIQLVIILMTQSIIFLVDNYQDYFVPILKKFDINNMNFISILAHLNIFSFLGWYYYLVLRQIKIANGVKFISIFLFFVAIINYLFVEGYKNQNFFNSTASNIFCFVLPCIHLWFLYREETKVPILKNPYFWISLGLFIPNLLGLITSIFGKKLEETDLTMYLKVDIAYCILQILGYLVITIGFYYARYTKYLPQKTVTPSPLQ